jgi:lysophospholipase L1-like esterase
MLLKAKITRRGAAMAKISVSGVTEAVERLVRGEANEGAEQVGRAFAPRGLSASPAVECWFDPEVVDVEDTPATRALARALVSWLSTSRNASAGAAAQGLAPQAPIVAEGDSWFNLPYIKLIGLPLYHGLDIPGVLKDELGYPVESGAYWGDTLASIFAEKWYLDALRQRGSRILLLSGGGNDLLGGGHLFDLLNVLPPGRPARDYLNQQYAAERKLIRRTYRTIMDEVRAVDPAIRILTHGYAYAIPNLAGENPGFWVGAPMLRKGISEPGLARDIVRAMIDDHNEGLAALAAEPGSNLIHIDLRPHVRDDEWWDELHLGPSGLRRVAGRFAQVIDAVAGGGV